MDFKAAQDLMKRLRTPTHTTSPTALELEAAGMLESLVFQLNARIGAAKEQMAP